MLKSHVVTLRICTSGLDNWLVDNNLGQIRSWATKLRVCLDGRKWRERKGKDWEGERILCLDSKMGGKGFEGEELKGFDGYFLLRFQSLQS